MASAALTSQGKISQIHAKLYREALETPQGVGLAELTPSEETIEDLMPRISKGRRDFLHEPMNPLLVENLSRVPEPIVPEKSSFIKTLFPYPEFTSVCVCD